MFTGIVEEIGTVRAVERGHGTARLTVDCSTVVADARAGDSVNVNGCCLTVTALTTGGFTADLMGETLDRTALGTLGAGAPVNLERAVRADGRLGGHLVQGHVDGVGEVLTVDPRGDWTLLTVSLPEAIAALVVEKGSITVDGTSLTITSADADRFSVGLIPHTLAVTTLGGCVAGGKVNLEADIVAKHVERLLRAGVGTPYGSSAP